LLVSIIIPKTSWGKILTFPIPKKPCCVFILSEPVFKTKDFSEGLCLLYKSIAFKIQVETGRIMSSSSRKVASVAVRKGTQLEGRQIQFPDRKIYVNRTYTRQKYASHCLSAG